MGSSVVKIQRKMQQIIEANVRLQKQARAYNIRAGKVVFGEYSLEELKAAILTMLQGAKKLADIANLEVLRFSELDPTKIQSIEENNPKRIEIDGEWINVEYSKEGSSYLAKLVFSGKCPKQIDAARSLKEIPVLPSGRKLQLVLRYAKKWEIVSSCIERFKTLVADNLAAELWLAWKDPKQVKTPLHKGKFPKIKKKQYAICFMTGKPLYAYGTVDINLHRQTDSDIFQYAWFQSESIAQERHEEARQEFLGLQDEWVDTLLEYNKEHYNEPLAYLYMNGDKEIFIRKEHADVQITPVKDFASQPNGIATEMNEQQEWQQVAHDAVIEYKNTRADIDLAWCLPRRLRPRNGDDSNMLYPGMWAISDDEKGIYLYSIVYYENNERRTPHSKGFVEAECWGYDN